ncbi:hypothetical protein D3C76_1408940 [compost metagenome]
MIDCEGAGGDHVGVSTDSRAQCREGSLDVVVQGCVGHILANQHGELFGASRTSLEGLLRGLVRAVLPRGFHADRFVGADLDAGYSGVGVDVTVAQRAADLVERTLA